MDKSWVPSCDEVAVSLTALGRGQTYIEASKSVRTSVARLFEQAGREPPWSDTGFAHGQLAATWVETYAEGVLAADEETAWPEVVVLDATEFWRWKGGFTIPTLYLFCAYGYDLIEVAVPAVGELTTEQRTELGIDPFAVLSEGELENLSAQ